MIGQVKGDSCECGPTQEVVGRGLERSGAMADFFLGASRLCI